MRALITGINGQDGQYLTRLLLSKQYQVYGLARQVTPFPAQAGGTEVHLLQGDLCEPQSLVRALETAQPDEVYNLAAMSGVAASWTRAAETAAVNAMGVLHLLEAIRAVFGNDAPRFYQASSSEMFGAARDSPQSESTLLWPRSPYGVSKVFGHYTTINYRESYGLHASSGILFNHESPLRPEQFVTRKITKAVARISAGLQQSLVLGNIDVRRDWGFAGDYVEAMWRMLQQPHADDYVIATGASHSLRDFLSVAFARIGVDDWRPYVTNDDSLRRPADVEAVIGDPRKANARLAWEPSVSFEQLVTMMVEHDLASLTAPGDA